jgi:hypothetical protein
MELVKACSKAENIHENIFSLAAVTKGRGYRSRGCMLSG